MSPQIKLTFHYPASLGSWGVCHWNQHFWKRNHDAGNRGGKPNLKLKSNSKRVRQEPWSCQWKSEFLWGVSHGQAFRHWADSLNDERTFFQTSLSFQRLQGYFWEAALRQSWDQYSDGELVLKSIRDHINNLLLSMTVHLLVLCH